MIYNAFQQTDLCELCISAIKLVSIMHFGRQTCVKYVFQERDLSNYDFQHIISKIY